MWGKPSSLRQLRTAGTLRGTEDQTWEWAGSPSGEDRMVAAQLQTTPTIPASQTANDVNGNIK